jgi:hypothetical protein
VIDTQILWNQKLSDIALLECYFEPQEAEGFKTNLMMQSIETPYP